MGMGGGMPGGMGGGGGFGGFGGGAPSTTVFVSIPDKDAGE